MTFAVCHLSLVQDAKFTSYACNTFVFVAKLHGLRLLAETIQMCKGQHANKPAHYALNTFILIVATCSSRVVYRYPLLVCTVYVSNQSS